MNQAAVLINNMTYTPKDYAIYDQDGVLLMEKLLTSKCIELLKEAAQKQFKTSDHTKKFISGFDRFSNQFLSRTTWFNQFIEELTIPLESIVQNEIVFTQAMILEVNQGSPGFLWHFDEFSFCFIRPEDMACTLWIPLTPIITKEQHGGLQWVSQNDFSAKSRMQQWAYHQKKGLQLEMPDNQYAIAKQAQYGDTWAGQYDLEILEDLKRDCDVLMGDALLFNRYTWHKTHEILPGPMKCRTAIVLRVVSADAVFDKDFFETTIALRNKVKLPPSFGHLLAPLDDGITMREAVEAGISICPSSPINV